MSLNTIKYNIMKTAIANKLHVTDNMENIAKAKLRMFGEDNWNRCPCDPDSDKGCLTDACRKCIEETGTCHCNLYETLEHRENRFNDLYSKLLLINPDFQKSDAIITYKNITIYRSGDVLLEVKIGDTVKVVMLASSAKYNDIVSLMKLLTKYM